MNNRRQERGFSLIELLIAVAVILIVAAISIPNLLRSRINANEASAIASMRTINNAEVAYSVAFPATGYADDLSKLKPPPGGAPPDINSAGLLDAVLACTSQPCSKSGYQFAIVNASGTPVNSYELTAVPTTVGNTGIRGFCSDQQAQITFDPNGATSCSQALP